MADSASCPRMRPVEAFPIEDGGRRLIVLHDPAGFAAGSITVSPAAMYILYLLDGTHTLDDIQSAFTRQFDQEVPRDQLDDLISQLDQSHYLDSPGFARHYQAQADAYRAAPARICRDLAAYGLDGPGRQGDLPGRMRRVLDLTLENGRGEPERGGSRRLTGLIAPHLDYGRGARCYAVAYGALAATPAPRRVVILGTNHFGRGTAVVATGKDFETPLGLTRTDRTLLAGLQDRCGADLCEHEFDHAREHSVELQVLLLQHVLGIDAFEIVPVLCPDPCGPTGTAPRDGQGADLRIFAEALGELIRADDTPTLIVAGADLSHVGRRFGDECDLAQPFLEEVEMLDREALADGIAGRQDDFTRQLADRDNSTRICSAGCIYALRTALNGATGELLRYHQAVDAASDTCVTCCAAAFWEA